MCWPSALVYSLKALLIGIPSMEEPPARFVHAGCCASFTGMDYYAHLVSKGLTVYESNDVSGGTQTSRCQRLCWVTRKYLSIL